MILTIDCAAIEDATGKVHSVHRPGRHCSVISKMAREGVSARGSRQGFLTSEGVFVGRETAFKIAQAAGQLIGFPHQSKRLFSEDVW